MARKKLLIRKTRDEEEDNLQNSDEMVSDSDFSDEDEESMLPLAAMKPKKLADPESEEEVAPPPWLKKNPKQAAPQSKETQEEGRPLKKPKKSAAQREEAEPKSQQTGSGASSPFASDKNKKTAKTPASANKIFSDADEVVLLKQLAVYWKDGRNNNWVEFHNLVKDQLSQYVNKSQVCEKIRNIRRKFGRTCAKGGPGPSSSHQSTVFALSKQVFGDGKVSTAQGLIQMADDKTRKQKQDEERKRKLEAVDFERAYPLLYASFQNFGPWIAKDICVLIPPDKAQGLEDQWKQYHVEESRLVLKQLELLQSGYNASLQRN